MRRIAIVLAVMFAVVAVVYAGMRVLFETSGEVIDLRTQGADGRAYESRLWVVDVDGQAYLRTGSDKSQWLKRLRLNPQVSVTRSGVTANFIATPNDDPAIRVRVNAATAEKYGIAESILRMGVLDPEHTVAIRLVPG
ncbi:MAG: DUF2255 family protein [Proteobacteria bacterium]|nr:DUF2255 family protein [Pseudomonadota bacterium]